MSNVIRFVEAYQEAVSESRAAFQSVREPGGMDAYRAARERCAVAWAAMQEAIEKSVEG